MNIYPVNLKTSLKNKERTALACNLSLFGILVIEPDPIHRYIISVSLKRYGIQLEFIDDLKAVSKMVLVKNYNLILVCIRFFFSEEENMIRSVRLLDAYKKIPIVGMTVLPTQDTSRKPMDADICEIMTRPFNPELVLNHYFGLSSNKGLAD